jgi:phosphopantetheinyl transferase
MDQFSQLYNTIPEKDRHRAGAQQVLSALMGREAALVHDAYGKPWVEGSPFHLSVSHSHGWLVVALNEKEPVGVDIELMRDKVVRVQHKFLSGSELEEADGDVERLVTFWAAKEAMYKYYGLKALDFCNHLHVQLTPQFTGEIEKGVYKKRLLLGKEKIKQHILVYTLGEY